MVPTAFSKSALSAVMSIMSINIYQQLLSVIIELSSCIIIIHDDNGS